MKPQTLYRGHENKNIKPTKMEKAYDALKAEKSRVHVPPAPKKKSTA